MELIAAQDDARAAREETRRLKAELAFVEADRHKVQALAGVLPMVLWVFSN